MRVLLGITGATGAIYGIRFLEVLAGLAEIESHLVISPAGRKTIALETDWNVRDVERLAHTVHRFGDIAAAPSSGSFRLDAVVVMPCSMKTLAAIAFSMSENLIVRAADVALKERWPLVLVPRETPLHLGHLRAMVQVTEIGAIVMPPLPAFYHRPRSVDDIVNQTVNRVLDTLGVHIPEDLFQRWAGRAASDRPEAEPARSVDHAEPRVQDGGKMR